MMDNLHFAGSYMSVSADELPDDLRAAMMDCGAVGNAMDAVEYVRENFIVTGDESNCRAFLRGYGAWDDDELSNHDENLNRLVWLAAGDLCGSGEFYFERN